jgi:hypothetical protein
LAAIEVFRSSQIAPSAESELDRAAVAVDSSIQIYPPPADCDVCLVHEPSPAHGSLAPIELLEQELRSKAASGDDKRIKASESEHAGRLLEPMAYT